MDTRADGRANQRTRTRKDLLRAAARLTKEGAKPTLEAVAGEAMVSRATAYRYFSSIDALLLEAALDVAVPDAHELLRDAPAHDPVLRVERVDAALEEMIRDNEPQLRMMLARSLERAGGGDQADGPPVRQNRRTPLIEAALAPARKQFRPAALKSLSRALALIIGTEARVVCRDVLELDDAEAREVRRWAIRALVDAAQKPAGRTPRSRP